jgi:hypothetical protein
MKKYKLEDAKKFPRQFKTISIKEAMKMAKDFIPRPGKEFKKPNKK